MIVAGIDVGSITTKAVILSKGDIVGTKVIFTGYNAEQAGSRVYSELLAELSIENSAVAKIVSTGYGRSSVAFADKRITEILCHGAGAHHQNAGVRSIIDIGGQDSKVMLVDEGGNVNNFAMNDKCAAGTGRFLEVMARALEVDLEGFGEHSLQATNPSRISSTCTVFSESEVISLIAKGETRDNIIAGIHDSIASRISSMARRIGIGEPVMMTGGVAKNIGVVKALEMRLGMSLEVTEMAQINGALGAAVLAMGLSGKP